MADSPHDLTEAIKDITKQLLLGVAEVFDSPAQRDTTYTGAQVAEQLRRTANETLQRV